MNHTIHLFFTSGKTVTLPAVDDATKDALVAAFMDPPYHSIPFATPSQTLYISVDKIEYFSVSPAQERS